MRYLAVIITLACAIAVPSAQTRGVPLPPPPPGLAAAPNPPWDAPHLSFDVASVKANKSGQNMMMMRTLPTSFAVTNMTLRMVIAQAYRLASYQFAGGPGWLDSDHFDIVAKAPEGSRTEEAMLMLRGLLAERFMLKVHRETRDTPIYVLMMNRSDGKLGPKMSRSTQDCEKIRAERLAAARARGPGPIPFTPPAPGERPVCSINFAPRPAVPGGPPAMTFVAGGQTLDTLVRQLSSQLNRLVVDKTGLTGLFDYEFQFGFQNSLATTAGGAVSSNSTTPAAPVDDGPTVFDSVKELGLKLEAQRGPVDYLVIDSAERPTED